MRRPQAETIHDVATCLCSNLLNLPKSAMQELAMSSRINNEHEQIDYRTSRSICDAVGERLQQSMRPETELSPHLQRLVDELRQRDNDRP